MFIETDGVPPYAQIFGHDDQIVDGTFLPTASSASATRGHAALRVGRGGRVVDLDQRAPLRVLIPHAADDPIALAVLVNTAGGLVGGDVLFTQIDVDADAAVVVTGQAAEKVYRSAGSDTVVENRLAVASGGWLEWLPQSTILFDGARLRRRLAADIDVRAKLLLGEVLVFGRVARGERLRMGLLRDDWEIRRGGRLVWADRLHLEGNIEHRLDDPIGFRGAAAYGTLIYVAEHAADQLETVRGLAEMDDEIVAGVTCIGPLIVARWLGREPDRVRRALGRTWAGLRRAAAGLPATLPRIWHI